MTATMTLTQYAKQMGISRTTLYRRIADAGMDMTAFRDTQGELTDEGLTALSAILDGTLHGRTTPQAVYTPDTPDNGVNLMGQIAELQRQLDVTRDALDKANTRIAELQQQAAERAERHADELRDILIRQQQIEAQRLLTGKTDTKRGIFGRWRDALFGTRDEQKEGTE